MLDFACRSGETRCIGRHSNFPHHVSICKLQSTVQLVLAEKDAGGSAAICSLKACRVAHILTLQVARAEAVGLGVPLHAAVWRGRRGAGRGAAGVPAAQPLVQGPLPDVLEPSVPPRGLEAGAVLPALLLQHLPVLPVGGCGLASGGAA